MKLENKIAIVTGAGRGMGHAMAVRFAKEGAQVVVAEVHEESGRQTFEEIGRRGMLAIVDMGTHLYEEVQAQVIAKRGISAEDAQRRLEATIPLGRSNSPDDIASVACFLASPESDNITGQSINVDGGLTWD